MIAPTKFSWLKSIFRSLISDDTGGETVEWVLLVGLIAVVCFLAMKEFGINLSTRWNDASDIL